jgi:hypothetical protein
MQSTVYTIGTALGRARDHGVEVRVLVSGHWIEGAVSEVDGHGVILTGPDASHHVVRLTDVSAVQVSSHRPTWQTDEAVAEPAWWNADDEDQDDHDDEDHTRDDTPSAPRVPLLVAR